MRVWRICRRKWAASALSGEGARLAGGRWNEKGDSIVYTSATLSLATLELFVHLDAPLMPPDLVAVPLDLPPKSRRAELSVGELPPSWRDYPAPSVLQQLGSAWIRERARLALVVPSAVVPAERNVLLNPAHPDFAHVVLGEPEPYSFDPRIWKQ